MGEEQFDRMITDSLHAAADHVNVSPCCKDWICEQIDLVEAGRAKGELYRMRNWTFSRVAAAVLASCLVIGTGAFAAGKIVSVYSHSSSESEIESYSNLGRTEEEAGFQILSVEKFTNGFSFMQAEAVDTEGRDEENNTVNAWKRISLVYKDDLGRVVYADAEPEVIQEQDLSLNALEEKEIAGTMVYYDCIEHLFVPADYKPSDEELAREAEDPHFAIAYGDSETRTVFAKDVVFSKGGVKYLLLTFDDVSKEELFGMAEEIIRAE